MADDDCELVSSVYARYTIRYVLGTTSLAVATSLAFSAISMLMIREVVHK